ncbi:hypothetical protein J6TS2_37670 [Heyndrickxia sporothermodurans]|nr:hypothetical protein J6TS2_37670 [Heyndrickxia sporothermodurans]
MLTNYYLTFLIKAIEKRVEQLEGVRAPNEEQTLKFHQPNAIRMHNKYPIMAGNKMILKEVSFQFSLGSTIAIKGNNGSEKSTLLRHIIQKGEGMIISPKAEIGIFEQMAIDLRKRKVSLDM